MAVCVDTVRMGACQEQESVLSTMQTWSHRLELQNDFDHVVLNHLLHGEHAKHVWPVSDEKANAKNRGKHGYPQKGLLKFKKRWGDSNY